MGKLWYTSKTLWVSLIAIVGVVFFGGELGPETQATILMVIAAILRFLTKEPVVWSSSK